MDIDAERILKVWLIVKMGAVMEHECAAFQEEHPEFPEVTWKLTVTTRDSENRYLAEAQPGQCIIVRSRLDDVS